MRILIVAERFPPHEGGLAQSTRRLAEGIANRGAEVHLLVKDAVLPAGDLQSTIENRIVVHRFGSFREEDKNNMSLCLALESLHLRHPFDVLVGIYVTMAGFIAVFEGKMLGIPSLVMARGNDIDRDIFRPERNFFVKYAIEKADAVGCVSKELVKKCKALVRRSKIYHTPNGVDVKKFTPGDSDQELKDKYGLHGLVVGFSGQLRFKKGMSYLLSVAEEIAQEFEDVKFLLVGGVRDDDLKEYKRIRNESKILKKILVETPYFNDDEELCRHYRLMDVLFMPSYWEGMPNSLLEAFACGVPVVASTAGGLKELVLHGKTGLAFHPGDYKGALNCLTVFLKMSPTERAKMGQNARRLITEKYTSELEIKRIMKILKALLH
jgi:glycosyltransferase involved in cell wall biosynthesis